MLSEKYPPPTRRRRSTTAEPAARLSTGPDARSKAPALNAPAAAAQVRADTLVRDGHGAGARSAHASTRVPRKADLAPGAAWRRGPPGMHTLPGAGTAVRDRAVCTNLGRCALYEVAVPRSTNGQCAWISEVAQCTSHQHQTWRAPNAPKLKRRGREGKRAAARQDGAPSTQVCARKVPGPLSLAARC